MTEPVLLPDPDEIPGVRELEELGTQLDALRLAGVAREVFPELKEACAAWQIARAIVAEEARAQSLITEGARLREPDRAGRIGPILEALRALVEANQPRSGASVHAVRRRVEDHFGAEPAATPGTTSEQVTDVILMSDALLPGPAPEQIAEVRRNLDKLARIDAELG